MRVAAITPLYPPNSPVGAWMATHLFLRDLVERGHQVTVSRYMAHDPGYEYEGVTVIDGDSDPTRIVAESDIVISHLGDARKSRPLAERCRKPLVRMVHGEIEHAAYKLEGTDLAVFNSKATQAVSEWDGLSIVCHPPVDLSVHRTTPGDKVTLVNLCEEKGGRLLPVLAQMLPEVDFLGVEGGWGKQILHPRHNLEVRGRTENMRDDVYARTKVLLMPSGREAWGMVAMEAMASGIPVIAHPTPGLKECLGTAGTFVDRADVDGWAKAIARLIDATRWQRASTKATARAEAFDRSAELDRFANAVEEFAGVLA